MTTIVKICEKQGVKLPLNSPSAQLWVVLALLQGSCASEAPQAPGPSQPPAITEESGLATPEAPASPTAESEPLSPSLPLPPQPEAPRAEPPPGNLPLGLVLGPSDFDTQWILDTRIHWLGGLSLGYATRSRVFSFRPGRDRVTLLDWTEGTGAPFAELPLLAIGRDFVVVSVDRGLGEIGLAPAMFASDILGTEYRPGETSIQPRVAILNELTQSEGRARIRVVGRVSIGAGLSRDAELEFALERDPGVSGFMPRVSQGPDQEGFFETAPLPDPRSSQVLFSTRHSLATPIEATLAPGTPEELREAIADGIRYWNRILGPDRIRLTETPGPRAIVVRWVPWDARAVASAGFQVDPRNGQIRGAEIEVTSGFARRASALPRAESAGSGSPASICRFESRGLGLGLVDGVAPGGIASQRATQDILRAVVAHEVGHALGLRHNFAGSLGQSYALVERGRILKTYLREGTVDPALRVSSTVMEYLDDGELALVGAWIRANPTALPYDVEALTKLYDLGPPAVAPQAYCTDSHWLIGRFLDCRPWDAGVSLAERARWSYDTTLADLPGLIARAIHDAAQSGAEAAIDRVSAQLLDPGLWAESATREQRGLFRALGNGGQLLQIRRPFGAISPMEELRARDAERAHMRRDLVKAGGFDLAFPIPRPSLREELVSAFVVALGPDSGLAPETSARVKSDFAAFASALPDALLESTLAVLESDAAGPLGGGELGDELARFLLERFQAISLAESGSFLSAEISAPAFLRPKRTRIAKLPIPAHAHLLRLAAARALRPGRGATTAWAVSERAQALDQHQEWLDRVLPKEVRKAEPAKLPADFRAWLEREAEIRAALESASR